jgi:hypothetical protein
MNTPASSAPAPTHRQMLGARLASHIPGLGRPSLRLEQQAQGLFLLWLALAGVLVFGAAWLWQVGGWQRLLAADPTGLTLLIVLIFSASTLWCGQRAWQLGLQQQALDARQDAGWAHDYVQRTQTQAEQQAVAQALLSEHTHGPHEMAWWVNGIQLKLGLLGKVIGFSLLAFELGQASFEPSQSADLLRSLTGGLGIALLTTLTGLTANILLGLQLMRLDRFADQLVAQTLARSLSPAHES